MVCRFADPELYQRLTAPVKERAVAIVREIQLQRDRLWEKGKASLEEAPEEQAAGEAAIWTDLSQLDETVTRLESRGDEEILTGGTVEISYFNQGDAAWSEKPYGSDSIGKYGCGPTVMAMAASSLTGREVNPAEMAAWAREHGHWAKKRGSYLSVVEGAAKAFGMQAAPCGDLDASRIRQELASGKLLVALMSQGHFTQGGHFILLRGATLDGGILVADPSSRERSLLVWDVQIILDELSKSRNNGAPLWILTPQESLAAEQ